MLKGIAVGLILAAAFGGFLGCDSSSDDTELPISSNNAAVPHPTVSQAEKQKAVNDATQAVDSWLRLIDSGMYSEAWDQTGQIFKSSSIKVDWAKQIGAIRTAMGPIVSRKLKEADYSSKYPEVPLGSYVRFHYDTAFKATSLGAEEVTAMRDKDGIWRPLGYYLSIKNPPPTPAKH